MDEIDRNYGNVSNYVIHTSSFCRGSHSLTSVTRARPCNENTAAFIFLSLSVPIKRRDQSPPPAPISPATSPKRPRERDGFQEEKVSVQADRINEILLTPRGLPASYIVFFARRVATRRAKTASQLQLARFGYVRWERSSTYVETYTCVCAFGRDVLAKTR